MNDEEFKRYEELYESFVESRKICDPIEYMVKQKNLLHNLIKWILDPYFEELKKRETDPRRADINEEM